ncbi:MAG TPA: 3-oxoacyl-[acyl-carrier-protein] synthase III C-terminal domain-containing protein [Syntrophales bacterium]|nr:3-oxoacyl-[acyl-carrier-protein] synthase III C-terminal domain-containing protein [Syntrophales bacterium]HRU87481.1 3-oxoacyl-[acyl-carrier-protein] synthase III C-terminal domain-containing protein [Syntrophales bacterium]
MLYLHGLGHFHPENVITNRFLEDLDIGTSDEWVLERVGIRERRTSLDLAYIRETKNRDPRAAHEASRYTNAQTGAAAARQALAQAGIGTGDIGLVVSGSSAPDHVTPSEAATVAAELGIEAPCLDINAACATFGVQLTFLDRMRSDTLPLFTLVVNPENLTRCVDYGDRSTAVLFGDGSAAAVVSAVEPARIRLRAGECASHPASWQKAVIPRGGYFRQEGNAVQGFAIRKMTEAVRKFQGHWEGEARGAGRCRAGIKGTAGTAGGEDFRSATGPGTYMTTNGAAGAAPGDVHGRRLIFIGHQANLSVLNTVCERSGIPDENHWRNVTLFGNTGCSGAPAVLSQRRDDLGAGDVLVMALVGAGLTWATLVWEVDAE